MFLLIRVSFHILIDKEGADAYFLGIGSLFVYCYENFEQIRYQQT